MTDARAGMAREGRDVEAEMDDRMLVGERVRLRAIRRGDLPVVVEHYNDRDVVQFLTFWDGPYGEDDANAWFDRAISAPVLERPMAIATLPDDGYVGTVSVDVRWRPRVGRLGIAVWRPDARGKGYGSEALELMLAHCFRTLNLNRVELDVLAYNARAVRAYEKVGFLHEGRRRSAWFWDGEYHDLAHMGILRAEYEAR